VFRDNAPEVPASGVPTGLLRTTTVVLPCHPGAIADIAVPRPSTSDAARKTVRRVDIIDVLHRPVQCHQDWPAVWRTTLGAPVVPEVYRIISRVVASRRTNAGGRGACLLEASCQSRSRPVSDRRGLVSRCRISRNSGLLVGACFEWPRSAAVDRHRRAKVPTAGRGDDGFGGCSRLIRTAQLRSGRKKGRRTTSECTAPMRVTGPEQAQRFTYWHIVDSTSVAFAPRHVACSTLATARSRVCRSGKK